MRSETYFNKWKTSLNRTMQANKGNMSHAWLVFRWDSKLWQWARQHGPQRQQPTPPNFRSHQNTATRANTNSPFGLGLLFKSSSNLARLAAHALLGPWLCQPHTRTLSPWLCQQHRTKQPLAVPTPGQYNRRHLATHTLALSALGLVNNSP